MGASPLTKIDVALTGIAAIGFDTAPFIYFIERHPAYIAVMREILRRVDTGIIAGYSSTITLAEVLTLPYQAQDTLLAHRYHSLLLHSRNFMIVPVDAAIAVTAAELRARYRLRTPDALQLATAKEVGCDAFLTNDHALKRVRDIPVLLLDELEI